MMGGLVSAELAEVKEPVFKVGPLLALSTALTSTAYVVEGARPLTWMLWVVARSVAATVMLPTLTEPVVGSSVSHSTTALVDEMDLNNGPEVMRGGAVSLKGRIMFKSFIAKILKLLMAETEKLELPGGVTVIE